MHLISHSYIIVSFLNANNHTKIKLLQLRRELIIYKGWDIETLMFEGTKI